MMSTNVVKAIMHVKLAGNAKFRSEAREVAEGGEGGGSGPHSARMSHQGGVSDVGNNIMQHEQERHEHAAPQLPHKNEHYRGTRCALLSLTTAAKTINTTFYRVK
ncbi:unnamed protein product [Colias eurytheme]|nr:unnamed protein product [Colias eurytheme]